MTNSTSLTYQPVFIRVGELHKIISASPNNQWISIKAYNATTNDPLTIGGKDEIVVSYSINKYSHVYHVATGEFSQTFLNKTPAQAFTPPVEKKICSKWALCTTAQAGNIKSGYLRILYIAVVLCLVIGQLHIDKCVYHAIYR